jgi:hypothetical protein
MKNDLIDVLKQHRSFFNKVVPFNEEKDKLLLMDFTSENVHLSDSILADTNAFTTYVFEQLKNAEAVYGIGGYNEHRTIYSRSSKFDGKDEPRRLHLGVDVWGEAGTAVYAALDATIHSFNYNDRFGDYGATIILEHVLEGITFYSLYGHLSLKDIWGLQKDTFIPKGTEFAHFGDASENGNWPPHLHMQVIKNLHGLTGDYPGVCRYSQREEYLQNCPDPDLILGMMKYAITDSEGK